VLHLSLILASLRPQHYRHPQANKTTARSLVKMQWATLLATAALAQNVAAQNMLRFACSQLVVERTDPLVNPGMKYTPHLHQIVGGDAFNVTMDPTNDLAQTSKCTSCSFVQDKSNYVSMFRFSHYIILTIYSGLRSCSSKRRMAHTCRYFIILLEHILIDNQPRSSNRQRRTPRQTR
jgi:hypothetical protein